jgi:acyl carrier protein
MTLEKKPAPTLEILLTHVVTSCCLKISPQDAAQKTLAGLGLDSLELMNLAIELDDNFDLKLNLERVTNETPLGEMLQDLLDQKSESNH